MYHYQMDGPVGEARWAVLHRRGLVTAEEQTALTALRKAGTRICAWCQTIVDDLRLAGDLSDMQAKTLNDHLGAARGLAAKQIAYQLTEVPFPFVHALTANITLLLLSLLWNSAMRLTSMLQRFECPDGHGGMSMEMGDADVSSHVAEGHCNQFHAALVELLSMVTVLIIYKGIWHSALSLSQPYGMENTDYDIDLDLQQVWVESLEQITSLEQSPAPTRPAGPPPAAAAGATLRAPSAEAGAREAKALI